MSNTENIVDRILDALDAYIEAREDLAGMAIDSDNEEQPECDLEVARDNVAWRRGMLREFLISALS